jgi:hypothetical protein
MTAAFVARRSVALVVCTVALLLLVQLSALILLPVLGAEALRERVAPTLATLCLTGLGVELLGVRRPARAPFTLLVPLAELVLFALLCRWGDVPVSIAVVAIAFNMAGYRWLAPRLAMRLPDWLDALRPAQRGARIAFFALTAFGLLQTARLTTFMAAPKVEAASIYRVPGLMPPRVKRGAFSTITTYVKAARQNERAPNENVYDLRLYPGALAAATGSEQPVPAENAALGLGNDSGFVYPPPFLLLPRALLVLTQDLLLLRFSWFAFELTSLALGFALLVRSLAREAHLHAVRWAPAFFASFTTLVALEVGNYHVAVLMLTLIAVVWVETGRARAGGFLLALGALTKIYPAFTFLGLFVWRRRVALQWAACAGVLLLGLTVMVCGVQPFRDFAEYTVPRMLSREAFPYLRDAKQLPGNFSIEALPLKLGVALGVQVSGAVARAFGMAFSGLALVLCCIGFASAGKDLHSRLLAALGASNLMVLTPPWAPGYVVLGFLLLLPLLPAGRRPAWPAWLWLTLGVLLFCPDLPFLPTRARCVYTSIVQCVGVLLSAWVLLRAAARAEASVTSGRPLDRSWSSLPLGE